ncbi:SpoIIE family protein phosphatase [Streptomyces sp. CA-106110]|uniref:SpoIIE family protein phosphatase n=1 Tax=Streptomyces sp. CA-106110 TaxID=3240044 RepID=UPI003D8C9059
MDTPASICGHSASSTAAVAVAAPDGALTGWSPGAQLMLGYSAAEAVGRPAAALLAARLPASARKRLAGQHDWLGRVVLRHRDGHWVECGLRARPLPTGDGRAGWLLEATPLPEDEDRETDPLLHWAFDQSQFALAIFDTEGRFLRINEPMARQLAATEQEVRGLRITEHMTDPAFQAPEQCVDRVAAAGEPEHSEHYVRVPGEPHPHAWIAHFAPFKDPVGRVHGVQLAALDFTEQAVARERLALINEASRRIGSTLDITRTAQELAEVAVPRLADLAAVDLLAFIDRGDEPPSGPLSGPVTMHRTALASIVKIPESLVRPGKATTYPRFSPPAECLATGRPAAYEMTDSAIARWATHDPARAARIRDLGAHSMMVAPIQARGVTLGIVLFARSQRPEPYVPDDILLAEEITARAAVCIDNARRYTRERTTAVTLQRTLLPLKMPDQAAVEIASRYLPAGGGAGVGGDWFDVIPLSGARVALVVGDVVGHGVQASATMGRLRTAVRTLADIDLPPDELLTHLDDVVTRTYAEAGPTEGIGAAAEIAGGLGATCLYAIYDPVSQGCRLARAGHPLPVVVGLDGTVDLLDLPAGPPLGLGGLPFEAAEVDLPEGSLLALYTDGLIESRGRDIDEGIDALRHALTQPAPSLDALCDAVLARLLPDRPDDIALLVARTRALPADQVATWDVPSDPAVVAQARTNASQRLAAWGLDELAFTTELVVSELVTNAIRYGQPPIQLRLIHDRRVICEVSDASDSSPHLRRARVFDEGGRGLMLVAQFAQRWGVRHAAQGKTIWAEMHGTAC